MATDLIRYDLLVQEALRGVVRRVLEDTMREGLPGDHHYYVTFRTSAPGVKLSERMRERYPDEMTIILQHQFWDLVVTETAFEVGLSFSGKPERLVVPFAALTGFFDPSVEFGLKFETQEAGESVPAAEASETAPPTQLPVTKPSAIGRESKAPLRGAGSEPTEIAPQRPAEPAKAEKEETESAPKVVSIDAFRKKP